MQKKVKQNLNPVVKSKVDTNLATKVKDITQVFFIFCKKYSFVFFSFVVFCGLLIVVLNFYYFSSVIKHTFLSSNKTAEPELVSNFSKPNLLEIKSLNISAPLVYVEQNNEQVFQQALQNGVVHYPGTAEVGEFGNSYFFGHSSDYLWAKGNYKSVFALLPKIKLGDTIKISGKDGKVYNYKVIKSMRVEANDMSVLSQGDKTKKLLSLQTSYPLGTALARWVVVGEIIETEIGK